jgi:rhodanese-related sulfurtransferase
MFEFITPKELAKQIPLKTFTIIDVRSKSSFDRKHIKTAINIEKEIFQNKKLNLTGDVVIHCQLSLVRGPFCASHLEKKYSGKVYLLTGGFKGWEGLYGHCKDLNEQLK